MAWIKILLIFLMEKKGISSGTLIVCKLNLEEKYCEYEFENYFTFTT
jgi:hypothetical protein